MDTAAEIEEREDNDGNSAFYNTRTQVWGWTREEVEENIEERVGEDGVKYEFIDENDDTMRLLRASACHIEINIETKVSPAPGAIPACACASRRMKTTHPCA